jgi:hypothetical protein
MLQMVMFEEFNQYDMLVSSSNSLIFSHLLKLGDFGLLAIFHTMSGKHNFFRKASGDHLEITLFWGCRFHSEYNFVLNRSERGEHAIGGCVRWSDENDVSSSRRMKCAKMLLSAPNQSCAILECSACFENIGLVGGSTGDLDELVRVLIMLEFRQSGVRPDICSSHIGVINRSVIQEH